MGPSFHSDSFSLPVLILKCNFCAKLSNIQSPKNLPLATTVLKFTFNSESAKSQRQSFWSPEWCWSKFLFVLFTECNLRSPNLDGSFCASEALNLCFFHSIHIFDKYYREVLTYLSDPLGHHILDLINSFNLEWLKSHSLIISEESHLSGGKRVLGMFSPNQRELPNKHLFAIASPMSFEVSFCFKIEVGGKAVWAVQWYLLV